LVSNPGISGHQEGVIPQASEVVVTTVCQIRRCVELYCLESSN